MKKILPLIYIALLVFFIGIILWWSNGTKAENAKDTSIKSFTITRGEATKQIAASLKDARLIQDPLVFLLLVKFGGYDGKIQAGDYQISPSQTPSNILQSLIKGTPDVWVTIPEGLRATEIAEKLQRNLSSYTINWDPILQQNEGYLFPDTYLFPKNATINQIVAIMRKNFDEKYALASEDASTTHTQHEIVILASIIQREGKTNDDMKYIASVLENRLQLGMALQVDAGIQYVIGTNFKWWPQPTANDLKVVSPYNTYKNPGLPPTPIANPGLIALTAALHPATSNYLYYFTDRKGVTHFSRTLDEQTANIAKFGE